MTRVAASIATAVLRVAGSVQRHPVVSAALLLLCGAVAVRAFGSDHGPKTLLYLAACAAAVIAADAVADATVDGRPGRADPTPLPVRRPWRELAGVAAWAAAGTAFLLARTTGALDEMPGLARFAAVVLGVAALFQVLPLLWFFARGYRPRELGFRVQGLWTAASTLAIVIAATAVADWSGAPLVRAVRGGVWGELGAVLLGAPLQVFGEEFMRLTLHTRIAAVTRNAALGWLLAVLPWAVLHVPMWVLQGATPEGAFWSAARIVPIGLVWSFVAWRTRSLLPAMLAHVLNLWGLQNP